MGCHEIRPDGIKGCDIAPDTGDVGIDLLQSRQQLEPGQRIDGENRQNAIKGTIMCLYEQQHEANEGAEGQQLHEIARHQSERIGDTLRAGERFSGFLEGADKIWLSVGQQHMFDTAKAFVHQAKAIGRGFGDIVPILHDTVADEAIDDEIAEGEDGKAQHCNGRIIDKQTDQDEERQHEPGIHLDEGQDDMAGHPHGFDGNLFRQLGAAAGGVEQPVAGEIIFIEPVADFDADVECEQRCAPCGDDGDHRTDGQHDKDEQPAHEEEILVRGGTGALIDIVYQLIGFDDAAVADEGHERADGGNADEFHDRHGDDQQLQEK